MDLQRQIAENPTQFDTLRFQFKHLMPVAVYTETTEQIFSSSIETINTVGNVIFTESVAEFYQMRNLYKKMVCDSLVNELTHKSPIATLKGTLDFSYSNYALISCDMLKSMRQLYVQCKQMMEVTDQEIEIYRKERERIVKGSSEQDGVSDSVMYQILQLQQDIDESKAKLKLP